MSVGSGWLIVRLQAVGALGSPVHLIFFCLFHLKFGSQAFDHTEQRGPLRMVWRKVRDLARNVGDRLLLGSGSKLHL